MYSSSGQTSFPSLSSSLTLTRGNQICIGIGQWARHWVVDNIHRWRLRWEICFQNSWGKAMDDFLSNLGTECFHLGLARSIWLQLFSHVYNQSLNLARLGIQIFNKVKKAMANTTWAPVSTSLEDSAWSRSFSSSYKNTLIFTLT